MPSAKILANYVKIVGWRNTSLAVLSRLRGTESTVETTWPGLAHPFRLRLPSTDVATFSQIFFD
ncbi:MAG: hypothetical protein ACO307_18660 [Ilumatobacteraceae bacterium]